MAVSLRGTSNSPFGWWRALGLAVCTPVCSAVLCLCSGPVFSAYAWGKGWQSPSSLASRSLPWVLCLALPGSRMRWSPPQTPPLPPPQAPGRARAPARGAAWTMWLSRGGQGCQIL